MFPLWRDEESRNDNLLNHYEDFLYVIASDSEAISSLTDCHGLKESTLAMTDRKRLPRSHAFGGVARNDKKSVFFSNSISVKYYNCQKRILLIYHQNYFF